MARPTVPARHESFTIVNEMIRALREMYDETPNEKILVLLNRANQLKELWWQEEDNYREQEIVELLTQIGKYPHAVRTCVTDYRPKKLE
jgi:hypothetical protein